MKVDINMDTAGTLAMFLTLLFLCCVQAGRGTACYSLSVSSGFINEVIQGPNFRNCSKIPFLCDNQS